jgi:hypothetical protein
MSCTPDNRLTETAPIFVAAHESLLGPFQTSLAGPTMSLAGGKADLAITNADF